MNPKKLSAILVILFILVFAATYRELEHQNKLVQELTKLSDEQQIHIADLKKNLDNLSSELNVSEDKLSRVSEDRDRLLQEIFEMKKMAKSNYSVIGVNPDGKGYVIPLEVVIKSGNGSLFLDVANVLFDESLQFSAQTAVKVAGEITKIDTNRKDILISIHAPATTEKSEIGGGSGGAAMTVAIIAALEGRNISRDVLITGTIEGYHTIGKIGAVKEKGMAAREWGAKRFIVPVGQNVSVPGLEIKEAFLIQDALKYIAPAD